jgi:transposase
VDAALADARANPGKVEMLYEDEASLYRQPTVAKIFYASGPVQPPVQLACGSNTVMRIAGFLNAVTGAVHSWDGSKITAAKIAKCMKEISALYPQAEKIYVVMDNWPVHFHEKVQRAVAADPRLVIVRLPTYSPWLNPIEKLWRLLKQSVVHAHATSNDFKKFKQIVRDFLLKPTPEPDKLLTYVGLNSK